MKGTFGVYVNLEEKDRKIHELCFEPLASLGDPLAELMLHVREVVKVVRVVGDGVQGDDACLGGRVIHVHILDHLRGSRG